MAENSTLLLLCAGRGTRMGGKVSDKVTHDLEGKPVFLYSLEAFLKAGVVNRAVLVVRDSEQEQLLRELLPGTMTRTLAPRFVTGGRERQDSVLRALEAVTAGSTEWVFIHDAARPLIRPTEIQALAAMARADGSAVLARPAVDTIKQLPEEAPGPRQAAWKTLPRDRLWAVETPQVYRHPEILEAYRTAVAKGARLTDDASAFELSGRPVSLLENSHPNPKLTRPQDFDYASVLLQNTGAP